MNIIHPDTGLRISKVQEAMQAEGIDALIAASNVSLLYLFGEIYSGIAYIPQSGEAQFLVRRPHSFGIASNIHYIRKIEQLAEYVDLSAVHSIALELDELPYSDILRQHKLCPIAKLHNATSLLRHVRRIKTDYEIAETRYNIQRHIHVYERFPEVYRPGMTDIELQIEVEHLMRQEGSIGVFRCFGATMEIHMGSLLVGDNAMVASPYDFALGGAGQTALPLGANGRPLNSGCSLMLDMAGNFGTYLSDITRTYSIGSLSNQAYRLHELSCRMHHEIMQTANIGTACSELYSRCIEMAREANALEYFMGYGQQAQFVGHGLGLQINELPVLTGRSTDRLCEGMLIAFEPKFVLPTVGAVGIENTYLITSQGIENLSPLPEDIINLEER